VLGFQEYHGFDYRSGDVVVIQGWQSPQDSNPSGHMAMFDGMQWISDFYQGYKSDPYPGLLYRRHRPSFRIYRHPDAANANGVGMTASGQGLRRGETP
jgi:streptogramin lyase